MKKSLICAVLVMSIIGMVACQKTPNQKSVLNGEEYDKIFIDSGYYFDKASYSEIQLAGMLERVIQVEKPEDMGTVEFPDLSTITLENNKKEEITEKDVEAELEKMRDEEVSYSPVTTKREAKLTDKVVIDFDGFMDGEKLEGGSGTDYELVLGSGTFIPGFEEGIVGKKAGKKFTIDLVFPEEYTEELAGKPVSFDVTIKNIQESDIPEVNEEFVKTHTVKGSTTVEEFKEEIRQKLVDRQEFMNKQNLTYQLNEKLSELAIVNPSEAALAWQFSSIIVQIVSQARQSNQSLYDYILANGETVHRIYKSVKESAPDYVKEEMIMDKVEKMSNENLTEDDVKKWFIDYFSAIGYGEDISYDDYKAQLGYDTLLYAAKQDKTLTKLIKECNIVDPAEEEQETDESSY